MPKRNKSQAGGPLAGGVRQVAGKVLRRGARRLDTLQARLLAEPARRGPSAGGGGKGRRRQLPAPEQRAHRRSAAQEAFFRTLEREGDLGLAATKLMRGYFTTGSRRTRIFAQVLQAQSGAAAEVGDICRAMLELRNERMASAWELLSRVDQAEALRLAPVDYFQAGFAVEPETAAKTLTAVNLGVARVDVDAAGWLEIARVSFAAAEDQSRQALAAAQAALAGTPDDRPERQRLRAEIGWLERWYGRRAAAAEPVARPNGEIPLAVLGYRQPDRDRTSVDLGDYLGTLSVLAQFSRRSLKPSGPGPLVTLLDDLATRVRRDQRVAADQPTAVRLYPVDRDASSYAAVPDGTWLIVTGRLPQRMFDLEVDLPLNPRLHPIFLSVHVPSVDVLTPEALDHLRAHGPIGCSDWSSVLLLQAAGVPAFFAGDVTATLDCLRPADRPAAAGSLYVDLPARLGGDAVRQVAEGVRTRKLAENLRNALDLVTDMANKYGTVTSAQPEAYFAARAVGAQAELRPANPALRRLDGLLGLDDAAFAAMQRGITDKLGAVLDALLAGRPADEVYAVWRDVTAASVAEADERRATPLPQLPLGFDLAAACATIRAASVTIERSEAAPDGAEINVEMSLDGNYKHQLEVVIDSIVAYASRPVRAFILCRDHSADDYRRMAQLFPTVSFVWLPTDAVDYGNLAGLISHTTVATIDRLLLPDLLPEVGRIIHHDLDAICLADLADLYDVDLHGNPIAGCSTPHPTRLSAFSAFLRKSERFPGKPEIGRDLIRRTHSRLAFDFPVFNAGVMVLDLAVMRQDNFCAEFLPYVARFEVHDQQVLNIYAGPRRVELAEGWNWQPWLQPVPAEPKIAHWAGDFKPWKEPWVVARDLWRVGEARLAERYAATGVPPRAETA